MAATRKNERIRRWFSTSHDIECRHAATLSSSQSKRATRVFDADDSPRSLSISMKSLCLTIKTSAASELIEEAEFGGKLGLCAALMYEKSLGDQSKWFQSPFEPIPLLWSLPKIDSLLSGTELHKQGFAGSGEMQVPMKISSGI